MGRQSNIKLKVTVANIIYYERLGEYYIRSKPQVIKQSAATKAHSKLFGSAARLEKVYRNMLSPVIPFAVNLSMQRKFRSFLYKYLIAETTDTKNDISVRADYFEFNTECSLRERFRVPIRVEIRDAEKMVVVFPAFQPTQSIIAPAGTESVTITVAAAYCTLDNLNAQNHCSIQLLLPYHDTIIAQQEIELPIAVMPKTVHVVLVSMQCIKSGHQIIKTKRGVPVAIVAVKYIQ